MYLMSKKTIFLKIYLFKAIFFNPSFWVPGQDIWGGDGQLHPHCEGQVLADRDPVLHLQGGQTEAAQGVSGFQQVSPISWGQNNLQHIV